MTQDLSMISKGKLIRFMKSPDLRRPIDTLAAFS